MKVPLVNLKRHYDYLKPKIDTAMAQCLEHQQWILGPEVQAFEKNCENYFGISSCIGTSSGTEALVIALRALALRVTGKEYFAPQQKIVTTPFTYVATGDAILRCGATPVLVDIDPKTYNLDLDQLIECLKNSKNMVGVMPVHLFGLPCDMTAIMELAKNHSLFVLEDCAQSFGAEHNNAKTGTIGDIGAFSFFPSKNLGAFGDAGLISTNDVQLADYCRILIQHGGRDKNSFDTLGYNARLDTLQAAVLNVKLGHLDEFNDKRRNVTKKYHELLKDQQGIQLPGYSDAHVYHQLTLRLPAALRNQLQKYLSEKEIAAPIYYPYVLNELPLFKNRCEVFGNLNAAKTATQEVLSLPMDPLINDEEIEFVCQHVTQGIKTCAES